MRKLKLFGKGYIIQHIKNQIYAENVEASYRAYITDCIAGLAGVEKRWADIYDEHFDDRPKPKEPDPKEAFERFKKFWNGGDES